MTSLNKRALVNSFLGSFCYVGLGTLNFFVNGLEDTTGFLSALQLIVVVLTFPVTIISWGFFYGGGYEVIVLISVIQFGTFLLMWYILNKELRAKYIEGPLFREYYHVKELIAEIPIDMTLAHLWRYTFTSKDDTSLKRLSEHLSERGYKLESLTQNKGVTWTMEVSKFEKLSVEMLAKRNVKFIELAKEYKLKSYEDWNFGDNPNSIV